jgi:GTP-binding protein HflX
MKDSTYLSSCEEKAPRAFLVSVYDTGSKNDKLAGLEAESLAKELGSLADTLGLEVAAGETVYVRGKSSRYGMGTGKAGELAEKARALEADCLVFDRELSPSRQKNWEELAGIPVIDRQELIIQIFAGRAKTREAELQAALAELRYSLPRLQHKHIDLNRQRGGRYGTRGSGETRLETDRRLVEQRIHRLEGELEEVRRQREVQRRQRQRAGIPVCALVGYTNAGKSSLLNALTGAGVLAEDKLFATLDSTSRRLELPGGLPVLLVDTVGFIRRLPHFLIDAFRSTLEEATTADLLIHILDASDPAMDRHYETTLSVLRELGAGGPEVDGPPVNGPPVNGPPVRYIPSILLLNKADRREEADIEDLVKRYAGAIPFSALTGRGLPELLGRMESLLSGAARRFRFPQDRTDLAALLYRSGTVLAKKYGADYIEMEARVDEKTAGKLRQYTVELFPKLG